ncbi:hypothetical protein GCM10027199_17310 [Amycolatopsis magusensis]
MDGGADGVAASGAGGVSLQAEVSVTSAAIIAIPAFRAGMDPSMHRGDRPRKCRSLHVGWFVTHQVRGSLR